ncbi:MAG: hypothetical protein R3362_00815 [Rhodothermales bacterium]|nr:hypothetical protein [Rhodothermales bacterium]
MPPARTREVRVVPIRHPGPPVRLVLEVRSVTYWKLSYAGRDLALHAFDEDADDDRFEHPLGFAHRLDDDRHDWSIEFVNVNDADEAFTATLCWMQGDEERARWEGTGTVAAGDVAQVSDWVLLNVTP